MRERTLASSELTNVHASTENTDGMESNSADRRDGFYVLKEACIWCGLPEAWTDGLMKLDAEGTGSCYFTKQPATAGEIGLACEAVKNACACAIRYGGTDPQIIRLLNNDPDLSDHIIDATGQVVRGEPRR